MIRLAVLGSQAMSAATARPMPNCISGRCSKGFTISVDSGGGSATPFAALSNST
jgi:hypothetical protein